jgi:Site-specific recombinase
MRSRARLIRHRWRLCRRLLSTSDQRSQPFATPLSLTSSRLQVARLQLTDSKAVYRRDSRRMSARHGNCSGGDTLSPRESSNHAGVREHVHVFVTADTLATRTDAFVALVHWTRLRDSSSAPWSRADYGRLDELLNLLDDPDVRGPFQAAVGALIAETDGTNAFAHAGIPSERGFPAELGERVINNVLPKPRNDQDLGHLIRLLFRSAADAKRLVGIGEERLTRLVHVLYPADHPPPRRAGAGALVHRRFQAAGDVGGGTGARTQTPHALPAV